MKALNQDTSLHGVIGVERNQSCHTSGPLLEPKQLSCSDSSLLKIECAKCNGNLKPPNQLSKEEGTENDVCNDCALLAIGITSHSPNPQSKKHDVSVKRAASKMIKLTLCSNCNIKRQRNEFGKKGWKVKECKECYVKFMCQKCRSMLKQDMFCTYADGDKMKICFPCITMSTVSCMECKEELPVAEFVTTTSAVDKRICKKCFQGDETSDGDVSRKQMIEQPTISGMQICMQCKEELPVADFDDTQLYTPVDKRRCKKCFQRDEPSDEDAPQKPMIEQPTNERLQVCVECKEELPVDDFDDTQLYTPIDRRICKRCCQGAEPSDEDAPQKQMIEQTTDTTNEQDKQKEFIASNSACCRLLSSSDPNQEVNERRQNLSPKSLKEQRVSWSSNEESRKRLRDYDGSDSEHARKVMKQNRCIYQSQNNNSSCHLRFSTLMKKIHVLGFQTCALREKAEALVESENEYKKKAGLSLRKRIDDFELCIFAVNEKLKKFDKDKNTECTRTTMKGCHK
ncbi:predicted protein [Chaetoceros tenuissimus]|uniref:Uncharacterized protein n=1 Tax=Chaetoceros tenuissimus TaxID=426638 RepID=A0AAD3CXL8_9STRA|nr:predicted protein [Chaetoceros tenuissimus]